MNWQQFIITPIVAAVVGLVVWYIQSRIERIHRAEERLRDERRNIYLTTLEPFIRTFAGIHDPKEAAKAQKQLISYEYKRVAFELNLVGSDAVVRSFNNLMQHVYREDEKTGEGLDAKTMMKLWGRLLIEIRRSVGDPKTNLEVVDMLKAQIKDIEEFLT